MHTDLGRLLTAADALVTMNSTVAIDALALRLPVLVVGLPNNLSPFVQAGAMADLTGLRVHDLPWDQVRSIYGRHPRHDVHRSVATAVWREAKAVPQGRFALLARCGFPLLVRLAPTRTL